MPIPTTVINYRMFTSCCSISYVLTFCVYINRPNIMRIIYQIDRVIARQLKRRCTSSLFTTVRPQHRSAARQMSNIYRLETQGNSRAQ